MRLTPLTLLLCVPAFGAQAKATPKTKAQAPKAQSADADAARKAFVETLNAVNDGWFGKPYQGITSVQLSGDLGISLSAGAVDKKVDSATQGVVKANSKGANVSLKVNSVYFANGDYRTELTGDFGNLLATRRADRGFIYSKEQNAYTTRVDAPPSDAPLTFMAWFRQTLNDIKAVYVDTPSFRASFAGEEGSGGRTLQRLVFNAPTRRWDAKKREQSLDDSLNFWKRGHLEVLADKASHLPQRMDFSNEEQGVQTSMQFSYDANGKLQQVAITNNSRGFDGPGSVRVGYGAEGMIRSVSGELSAPDKRISFNLETSWSKERQATSLLTVPPAGATKRGREELETGLLVRLAGNIMDLQRAGLNLRSVSLAAGNNAK